MKGVLVPRPGSGVAPADGLLMLGQRRVRAATTVDSMAHAGLFRTFATEHTIGYHIHGLFTELRVKNCAKAIRTAIEQGLIRL